jgi:hypothetical protein
MKIYEINLAVAAIGIALAFVNLIDGHPNEAGVDVALAALNMMCWRINRPHPKTP